MMKDDSSVHVIFFPPNLHRPVSPPNTQMCTHLCNEGFTRYSPTIASPSLCNCLQTLPAVTVWSRPALTLPVTWGKAAPLFFPPIALRHKQSAPQMCAVHHNIRSFTEGFPVDLHECRYDCNPCSYSNMSHLSIFVSEAPANSAPVMNPLSKWLTSFPFAVILIQNQNQL